LGENNENLNSKVERKIGVKKGEKEEERRGKGLGEKKTGQLRGAVSKTC